MWLLMLDLKESPFNYDDLMKSRLWDAINHANPDDVETTIMETLYSKYYHTLPMLGALEDLEEIEKIEVKLLLLGLETKGLSEQLSKEREQEFQLYIGSSILYYLDKRAKVSDIRLFVGIGSNSVENVFKRTFDLLCSAEKYQISTRYYHLNLQAQYPRIDSTQIDLYYNLN